MSMKKNKKPTVVLVEYVVQDCPIRGKKIEVHTVYK